MHSIQHSPISKNGLTIDTLHVYTTGGWCDAAVWPICSSKADTVQYLQSNLCLAIACLQLGEVTGSMRTPADHQRTVFNQNLQSLQSFVVQLVSTHKPPSYLIGDMAI